MVKEPACNAEDLGLILGLGRSPGEGNGNPLSYSCLKNSMDRGAWWATVHGGLKELDRIEWLTFFQVTNSQTRQQPVECQAQTEGAGGNAAHQGEIPDEELGWSWTLSPPQPRTSSTETTSIRQNQPDHSKARDASEWPTDRQTPSSSYRPRHYAPWSLKPDPEKREGEKSHSQTTLSRAQLPLPVLHGDEWKAESESREQTVSSLRIKSWPTL